MAQVWFVAALCPLVVLVAGSHRELVKDFHGPF